METGEMTTTSAAVSLKILQYESLNLNKILILVFWNVLKSHEETENNKNLIKILLKLPHREGLFENLFKKLSTEIIPRQRQKLPGKFNIDF